MLEISVGGDVYGLDDETAAELLRRVDLATAPLVGREPEPGTTLYKLQAADEAQASPELDDGDLALVGVVLEAWFQETDGDVPADAHELQLAIARHLD
jgi:hypothetical protein